MNAVAEVASKTTPGPAITLAIPPDVRPRVSAEAFERLCRENPLLRLERKAGGELIVMAPVGSRGGWRNAKLTIRLGNWAEADGTGEVFDSSTGYTLPNGETISPDVSWILTSRWDSLDPSQQEKFAPICPDFVAELRSASDPLKPLQAKMESYIEQGVRLAWLIDPQRVKVEVYRRDRTVVVLDRPAALPGEDVLPGFKLDLKGILFR